MTYFPLSISKICQYYRTFNAYIVVLALSLKLDIISTTRAYLCVIAARHFLIDPHGIVKASMCGLFIYFNYPVSRL